MRVLRSTLGLHCAKCGHVVAQHGYQPVEKIMDRGFVVLECLNRKCADCRVQFRAPVEYLVVERIQT